MDQSDTEQLPRQNAGLGRAEALGLLALVALAVWCVVDSWRKWPDPIADSGLQWYAFWRLAGGAVLYHDITWIYGPLSASFNAGLFKVFGPGMMVLVTANLIIYTLIAALAYLAIRKAWGRLAAFAALAVFIAIFSFARLYAIGNYNYATPYAHEATHGMLLLLITVFAIVGWCRGKSRPLAFIVGLCGGLAVVLKPEFMLVGGILGLGAVWLRSRHSQKVELAEFGLVLAGLVLPTCGFTIWFAHAEPWGLALTDASRAWWSVISNNSFGSQSLQQTFMGVNQPGRFALLELQAAGFAIAAIAAIFIAGWSLNRPWPPIFRVVIALGAGALAWYCGPAGGWFNYGPGRASFQIGAALPGLLLMILLVLTVQAAGELRRTDYLPEDKVMAFALALAAATMLARMPLRARVDHLGFYQAALAGMVVSAFLVSAIPRWIRGGGWGPPMAAFGFVVALAYGCFEIALQSHRIHADQTQAVGTGRDRFYADADAIDATGKLVDWTADFLKAQPPETTVCVLPEGFMINYLSRRRDPLPALPGSEEKVVAQLKRRAPDYVVFISRDLSEYGVHGFGGVGKPGQLVLNWLHTNYYEPATGAGGDPLLPQGATNTKGVLILHRTGAPEKPASPDKSDKSDASHKSDKPKVD